MSVLSKIQLYSTPVTQADFLAETLGCHEQEVRQGRKPFIIFGAGSAGENLLPIFRLHGACPILICDNSNHKIGKNIDGIPVVSVDTAFERYPDSVVVLVIGSGQEEALQQLSVVGFRRDQIMSIRREHLRFYTHIWQWYWSPADLEKHTSELSQAYQLLADESSRRLFLQRIAILTQGANFQSYDAYINQHSLLERYPFPPIAAPVNYYYFNNDVVQLKKQESLIDCGAFDGDTVEQFVLATQKFSITDYSVHCLEPDPKNFARLKQNFGALDKIHLYQVGAWSKMTTLNFESSDSTPVDKPSLARICLHDSGYHINVDSIDHLFADREVSFIKMDIEGAEMDALLGATKIIGRHKPTLAISVYHRRNDIFQIQLLIHRICPEYRFYLRLFSRDFTETVLLAIPN